MGKIKIKSPKEIELIRDAGALAAETLIRAGELCKPGVSTLEIDNIVGEYTKKHGGISACLGYHGYPKNCCISLNEVVCHGIPGAETILKDGDIVNIDITLERDSSLIPVRYERINLDEIPIVAAIDSSILIRNMNVDDVTDQDETDTGILYYTVQVMALYNPVDISYFRYITDMKVMYNERDKFYRYTTGRFATRAEASAYKESLLQKGYPDDIFVKKVSRQ